MGMEPVVTEEIIARQPPEAQAIIRALLAKIAELEAELRRHCEGRVKGKTPQNSSLPPSTQHPHAQPPPQKRKSKKKRGGQPGHEKHERPLIPTDECDDVQPLKPTECRRCGEKLSGSDPEPLRHQVWELPEIKPHVTEYQRHRLTCALLRRDDLCGTARRRAAGAVGAAVDGVHRAADGLLSPKQAADGRVPQHALGPAVLPGADGENPKPSDGGVAAVV